MTIRDDYPLEIDLIDSLLGVEGDVVGRQISCLWRLPNNILLYVWKYDDWSAYWKEEENLKTIRRRDIPADSFEDIITYIRENLCR